MAAWIIDRASVSSDLLDGEVVAIHLATGIYYSLRGTAATVWQALATPVDVAAIVAAVTAAHEIPSDAAATVAADVQAFLLRLRAEQLIIEETAAGSAAVATGPAPVRRPYAAPVLERFSDLQDLLLLDPIHDVGPEGWPQRPPAGETK